MRDMVVGGLLLPLRLYLQPNAFREQVAALAPDLPADYSLWQARHKLRDPAFRRGLLELVAQSVVALIWGPLITLVVPGALSGLGLQGDWVSAASDVALVVAFVVASDMAFGVAFVVAFGVAFVVAFVVASDVAFGVAFVVALVVASSVASSVARGVVVCVMLGVVVGVGEGVVAGVVAGVVFGVALVLTVTHAFLVPLQYLVSFSSWMLVRFSPGLGPTLWRFSPVCWDEVILPPLPGLVGFLVSLYRTDPTLGRSALAQVAAHRYQRRAAHKALVRLANEDARLVTSAPALAAFSRELDWLSEETPLPEEVRSLLFGMRDVSIEVDSALKSISATNRVRRYEAAADMLNTLRLQPGEFGSALARWSEIISTGLEEARRQQRVEEPIPQVYISDGRPVRPAARSELAPPFKGRETLFRQLEGALGGGEGQRATLLLYGPRRTGKTSALYHLPRRLGSRIVPAFLDLQSEKLGGAEDVAGLLKGLAEAVVDEARKHRKKPLPAIEHRALLNDPYPALGRWLDQVERALGESTLLLCLDEFEELEEAIRKDRLDRRILSTLRNIVQHRSHIAVLLSGSHQIDELPAHWSSALITTSTLPISFLEEKDTRDLITEPVADFPAIYTPAAVDRIIQMTHCQPLLVQLMCALLVERMNAGHRMPPHSYVEVEDVDAVVPLALERGNNYLDDLWRTQTGSDLGRHVLEALARAPGTQLDRSAVRSLEHDEAALRQALATLLRREIIQRTNGGYRIAVPMVAEYVRRQVLV